MRADDEKTCRAQHLMLRVLSEAVVHNYEKEQQQNRIKAHAPSPIEQRIGGFEARNNPHGIFSVLTSAYLFPKLVCHLREIG